MGRDLTADSPIFFVCGTPSDRRGFEYKALDGRHLPVQPSDLDFIPENEFPDRGEATHVLRQVGTGGRGAAVYTECRWIHPNDTEHNRGAYIAVGCWVEAPLSPTSAMRVLHRIESIHEDLAARRDQDTEAFPPDFRLRTYTPAKPEEIGRDQLTELLCRTAAGNGACKEILRDPTRTSGEVRQGALARLCILLCTLTSATARAPRQPDRPDHRGRQARSREVEVMRKVLSKVRQRHREHQKLLHQEKQWIKEIETSIRSASVAPPAAGTRRERPSGRYDGATGGSRWRPTPREIGFSAAGIIFGLMLALAVVGTVEFLSTPALEAETTPSTSD